MNSKRHKKVLIRNCALNVNKSKTKVIRDDEFVTETHIQQLEKAHKKATEEPILIPLPLQYLNTPVLNSTLSSFENAKAKEAVLVTNRSKLLAEVDIDVTKKLNFPVEAHLYKDLVSLNISNSCSSNEYNIHTSSKNAQFTKSKHDPVLKIENFLEPETASFVVPKLSEFDAPPLKPNRIFDMSYTQRMYDFEYEL